jgi:hypothetical protein
MSVHTTYRRICSASCGIEIEVENNWLVLILGDHCFLADQLSPDEALEAIKFMPRQSGTPGQYLQTAALKRLSQKSLTGTSSCRWPGGANIMART